MGKKVKPLSVAAIKAAPIGRSLADGLGLYFEIRPSNVGAYAYALFRYSAPDGKRREAGIGLLDTGATASRGGMLLAAIRDQAHALHRLVRDGRDPIAERQVERQQKHAAALAVRETPTFREALHRYVKKESPGWTSARYAAGWAKTVEDHAARLLPLRVDATTPQMVAEALKASWQDKPVTAQKVRARTEGIFDHVIAQGWRTAINPATLTMIRDLMPAVGAAKAEVKHFAAARWQEIGTIMQALEKLDSVGALAARFTVLTAARTEETRGATWAEFDLSPLRSVVLIDDDGQRYTETTGACWDVPAERMKGRRPHRVPLAPEALSILAVMRELHPKAAATGLVFPGRDGRKPMSIDAMRYALEAAGYGHLTVHGMRSCFRAWAGEATSFDTTLAEFALAHQVHGATERAYARGSLFGKRRELMTSWARFSTKPLRNSGAGDVVVELRPAAAG
jgi:integrase